MNMECRCLLYVVFNIYTVFANVFVAQPRIASENGNLKLEAPYNKNISFVTTGKGAVYINGVDLTTTANTASNVTNAINSYTRTFQNVYTSVEKYGNMIEGADGILHRLNSLESKNNSMPINGASLSRRVRQLQRRVNTVQRRVTTLVRFLREDECLSNPCKNGGTCQDLYKSFMCTCPNEWEGPTCEKDVNECAIFAGTDLGCQNGANCVNKPGSYECLCPTLWFGVHCTRRSADCTSGGAELCGHGTCVPQQTSQGYKCICDQGWTTDGTNPACSVDVNECSLNHPPCSVNPLVTCINVPGSFYCGNCPQGYTGNGYYCVDLDECTVFNGGCSINPQVQCINVPGSRLCGICPPGYAGDGITCSFQGVCSVNNGGCHPAAQCRHNPGISATYVECGCPNGYVGNGIGPQGCTYSFRQNPCIPNPCQNGVCSATNDTSGYTCACTNSYTGKNCDVKINYCLPNPCLNGGTCRSLLGALSYSRQTYVCVCPATHTGFNCQEQREACGGTLTGSEGVLKYPLLTLSYRHQINCAWVIRTNTSEVLNVTFTKFKLETSVECQNDFLQIHDGRNSASHLVGRFCGESLPKNGTIISSTHEMYLWFKSDESIALDGFELTWSSIPPVCGGEIYVETHGTIYSPGTPGNYPPNRDCYWVLSAPTNKQIVFHFFQLVIGNNADCSHDYLEFKSANEVFATYCNTSNPEPLYSLGSDVTVHFHSDEQDNYPGFQITYALHDGIPGCGGFFTVPRGEIQSPSYGDYPTNLMCEYKIKLPKTTRIKLTFLTFSLEDGNNCLNDRVSIYEGLTSNSPLIGTYCGSVIPATYITESNEVLILFETDESLGDIGFRLKYESVCKMTFTAPDGVIQSPGYPDSYPDGLDCVYEIAQPLGVVVRLVVTDLQLEETYHPHHECPYDYLEIRDGSNENATLVGKYCKRAPPAIVSTYNYLWMKFHSDSDLKARGFQANYTTIEIGCGGIIHTGLKIGHISPPTTSSEPSETNCKWILIAPPDSVIQLTWLSFTVEQSYKCVYDSVKIYENDTTNSEDGVMIGEYCGSKLPPVMISSSNIMTITYETDASVNLDGFTVAYTIIKSDSVCGGNFYTRTGKIRSRNYPEKYPRSSDCTWVINAPAGQQIVLNVTHFDLEKGEECLYDYIEIRNGGTSHSPLVGKYCGTKIPKLIPSHANQLYIHFVSDYTGEESGFELAWDSTTTGCGGILTSSTGSIISPNYPEPYGQNVECFWKINVNIGSRINIVFLDVDLEDHTDCRLDYLEVFDGWGKTSNSFGKFCSRHRPFLTTSTNKALLKFRSDISVEGRGFQLQYSTDCNNKFTGFNGAIESPNFPDQYPELLNCTWEIETYPGNNITVSFSNLELEPNCDDNVSISYMQASYDEDDPTSILSHTFCGFDKPESTEFPSHKITIRFMTDYTDGGGGFRLEWQSKGCGGVVDRPEGNISTPNYPDAYPLSTECAWFLHVDAGNSIEITFEEISLGDASYCSFDYIKIINGPNETYPVLSTLCGKYNSPVRLTSSGNSLYVHFVSDQSYTGKGFLATYKTLPSKCGGRLNATEGSIHSPNYPNNYDKNDTCEWLLEVEESRVIELTFVDVDFPTPRGKLKMDYMKVFDGPTAAYPVLAKISDGNKPNLSEVIRSTGNYMFVEMITDDSYTAKGFLANYRTTCGAKIQTESSGSIEYSHHALGFGCSWTISATNPADRVSLIITKLFSDITSYCDNTTYSIRIYNGEDDGAPLLAQHCGNHIPPVISGGSSIYITITSDVVSFFATYSVLDTHCGGTFKAVEGTFTTPNYPNNYPSQTQCQWTIEVTPGNSMSLAFTEFDLAESDNCEYDYLEIRKGNSTGDIVNLLCGKTLPSVVTLNETLWLLFESKALDPGEVPSSRGFLAEYTLSKITDLYGPSGKIGSPLYPNDFQSSDIYSWRITVPSGFQISITFPDFNVLYGLDDCYYSYMKIYEGYNSEAPQIANLCGVTPPKPISVHSSVAFIETSFRIKSTFLLEWKKIPPIVAPIAGPGRQKNQCQSDAIIDLSNEKLYNLTSPGYPYGNFTELECAWMFYTKPGNHLSISFTDVNLEGFFGICRRERINVYVGKDGKPDWNLVTTFCAATFNLYNNITYSNYLKVEFTSLKNVMTSPSGFAATIFNECGGSFHIPSGTIEINNSTNFPVNIQKCEWNVTVRAGKTIKITFREFDISQDNNMTCRNYVMLRNGLLTHSPFLGAGKYCGKDIPQPLETTANYLNVKYVGNQLIKGFRLHFEEVSIGCDRTISLTDGNESELISSPNYPNIPPPHIECRWVVTAPTGESIAIDFEERFDLTRTTGCTKEVLEIRDGGTELSPLIGRFCGDMPSSQVSTDRMVFMKYFTDIDDPRNGFKARVSVAKCGGTVRDSQGIITAPVLHDIRKINCTWTIIGPAGHFLTLNISTAKLGTSCNTNYLLLKEMNRINNSENELGKFCGSNKQQQTLTSSSNEVTVNFAFESAANNEHDFQIKFNSRQEECGGTLELDSGVFQSPGYPAMNHLNRYCKWVIKVRKGRRIKLELLDFDLDPTVATFEQGLAVYNGNTYMTRIALIRPSDTSRVMESSENAMTVLFYSNHVSFHRGFKAKYTSDEPTLCSGNFEDGSGILQHPVNVSSYRCTWERSKFQSDTDVNQTVALSITAQFDRIQDRHGFPCGYYRTALLFLHEKQHITDICRTPQRPLNIRFPDLRGLQVIAQQGGNTTLNFSLSYKVHPCGGYVSVGEGYIASPGYPARYAGQIECSWLLVQKDNRAIQITFSDLQLGSNCAKNFVNVYNGATQNAPKIANLCQNNQHNPIISESNNLLIEYRADLPNDGRGFNITYEPVLGGCGGIFHDRNKIIESPSYPNNYPNNSECLWEIMAENGYSVVLEFVDRMHLETSDNCQNDYVEVFDFKDDNWLSLGKVCGRTTPPPFNSTSNRMRVLFRSNDKISGHGFKAKWHTSCGGSFTADVQERIIVSPGYPKNYPNKLECVYKIKAPEFQFINIQFDDFDVESNSADCKFDNLTISEQRYPYRMNKNVFCKNSPPPLRNVGEITITFKTDAFVSRRGFSLRYHVDKCGGNITQPTDISSPSMIATPLGVSMSKCQWNVTAPRNKVVVLSIQEFSLPSSFKCMGERLEIFEGLSTNTSNRLLLLCGRILKDFPHVKSEGNQMLIMSTLRAEHYSLSLGRQAPWDNVHRNKFKASIYFSYGPSAGCGGIVNLTNVDELSIQPPSLSEVDCHWQVVTSKFDVVKIQFKNLDLPKCAEIRNTTDNCSCSFIELRDGAIQLADLIEKVCTNQYLSSYVTSGNNAFIRFYTRGRSTASSFLITVTRTPSVCGETSLNFTSEVQTFTSPGFPAKYPSNLKCTWVLHKPRSKTGVLKFVEFDLPHEADHNACTEDKLEISDSMIDQTSADSLGPDAKVVGLAYFTFNRFDRPKLSQFCGTSVKNYEYFSDFAQNLFVKFLSKSAQHGSGFKIEYSLIACSRNYTNEQGIISTNLYNQTCDIYIKVPQNRTISLYFNRFGLISENNCEKSGVIVYDGLTNNSNSLGKICGFMIPPPIFSTSNNLLIHTWTTRLNGYFEITYTSTDKGRGCGGLLYSSFGRFSSPLYPNSYRNETRCNWQIKAPTGLKVALKFPVFDIQGNCESNYVTVTTFESSASNVHKFCKGEVPSELNSDGKMLVEYKSSMHNGGTGWSAAFQAFNDGETVVWSFY